MTNPQISHPHPPLRLRTGLVTTECQRLWGCVRLPLRLASPPAILCKASPLPAMSASVSQKPDSTRLPTTPPSLPPCQPQASTFATRSPCPHCSTDFSGCIPGPLLLLAQDAKRHLPLLQQLPLPSLVACRSVAAACPCTSSAKRSQRHDNAHIVANFSKVESLQQLAG